MSTLSTAEYTHSLGSNYDREKELKAFDATQLGVKGVVDSGAKSLPKMFVRPADELSEEVNTPRVTLQVPVIDFEGIHEKDCYEEVVKQVAYAAEEWGFFQVVNHGIPSEVLDNVVMGIKKFHEQDNEAKKVFYTRELSKSVVYGSNYDLYKSTSANWRDTLAISNLYPAHLHSKDIPQVCRDVMVDYIKHILKLGELLLELLSVALGLSPDYLTECTRGWTLVNHYYPACPAPQLTLGTSKHSDPSFLTILLQDLVGGLQVLHQNQWVDVEPIPGAFVVNIGDILQVISNDKFQSVYHRVIAKRVGPRISSAMFLKGVETSEKLYGPIKEVVSEENVALYREFTLKDFQAHFFSRPLNEPGLDYWKVERVGGY